MALLAEIGFELSEHAQHIEKGFAGRGAGIYRPLGGLQAGTLGVHRAENIPTLANAARLPKTGAPLAIIYWTNRAVLLPMSAFPVEP